MFAARVYLQKKMGDLDDKISEKKEERKKAEMEQRLEGAAKSLTIVANPECVAYMNEIGFTLLPMQTAHWEVVKTKPDRIHDSIPNVACTLAWLVASCQAKRVLHFGSTYGFATHIIAASLPQGGQVIALEENTDRLSIARHHWNLGQVGDKINVVVGVPITSLQQILSDPNTAPFDFIVLSGDNKQSYLTAYNMSLKNLRRGGTIAITDTFLHGEVLEPNEEDKKKKHGHAKPIYTDAAVLAMRQLNDTILNDTSVQISALPSGDGITFVLKL